MIPDNLNELIAAAQAGKWWIFSALIIGAIVRVLKAKPEIANFLSPRIRPLAPIVLGIVSAAIHQIAYDGTPWFHALLAGVLSGAGAVLGHVYGIEVLRGGKEIGESDKPKPPVGPSIMAIGAVALVFGVVTSGCSIFTKKNANSALDAVQIACVFGTEVIEEEAVADACGIARELIPVIRNLIGQREAAKRAGVRWGQTLDGGVPFEAGAPDGGQ